MALYDYQDTPIDWDDILSQVVHGGIGGADDRDTWTRLAAGLQAAGGTDTHKDIFLAISRNSGGYRNDRDCIQVWNSYRRTRGITQATAIKFLHEHGVKITHVRQYDRGATWLRRERRTTLPEPPKPQPLPPADYYTEAADLCAAHTANAALLKSPLLTYLRRLYWGTPHYWNIIPTAGAYRHGYDGKGHDVFRYYDLNGGLCKVRYCAYDLNTGKRIKDAEHLPQGVKGFLFTLPKGAQHRPCFYGEHMVNPADTSTPIAIVESEKTAIIMAVLVPQLRWLATGGKSYLANLAELDWLKDWSRNGGKVILFPDVDGLDAWTAIARAQGYAVAAECYDWYCTYLNTTGAKSDIADYFLQAQQKVYDTPTFEAARQLAKEHPQVWKLMRQLECSVVPDSLEQVDHDPS